jgi:hypothetical protein
MHNAYASVRGVRYVDENEDCKLPFLANPTFEDIKWKATFFPHKMLFACHSLVDGDMTLLLLHH